MNNIDDMIGKALDDILDEELLMYEQMPDHVFSRKFKKKMKKLINKANSNVALKNVTHQARRIPLRKALLLAIIILFSVLILTGAAVIVIKVWENFTVEEHDIFSYLHVTNFESAPNLIEEHYELSMDLSYYTKNIISDNSVTYWIEYKDDASGNVISYEQGTKNHFNGVRLNTENAIEMPVEVEVGAGYNGVYFECYYGEKGVFWDNGKYIFSISVTGFSKDELIEMVNFVQKIEKLE